MSIYTIEYNEYETCIDYNNVTSIDSYISNFKIPFAKKIHENI